MLEATPSALAQPPQLLQGGAAFFPRLIAAIDGATYWVQLETYIFDFHGAGADVADALIPTMLTPGYLGPGRALAHRCMAAVPPATYRAALQALVRFEQREALSTITVPTLCLAAEHDKTAPPEVLRRMAEKIPGAQFALLPDASHLLCFEQPEAFNTVIYSFLSKAFAPS